MYMELFVIVTLLNTRPYQERIPRNCGSITESNVGQSLK